nr:hypothetical protein [Caldilineaceae bacterium]
MGRDTPKVEWHVAHSDAEWEAVRLQLTAERAQRSRLLTHKLWRWVILALPLFLASAQGWAPNPAPAHGPHTPISHPQGATVQAAVEPAHDSSIGDAQAETASNHAPVLLDRHEVFDRDVVRMLEHPETGIRQYQYTTTGRLRSVLDAAFWGPERQLETAYFLFRFRLRDTRTVTAVAAQVDALYSVMQRNLGLEATAGADKLVIEVSESQKVAAS